MKRYLLLAAMALPMLSSAQTIWEDDFNDENLDDWTLVDSDGDGNNWSIATLDYPVGGTQTMMRSASWISTGALTPDNWAISPSIDLTNYDSSSPITLNWEVSAIDADWDIENYSVYVATENTVAALSGTSAVFNETTLNNVNELTLRTVDLSSYAGQTVYLAFRHYGVSDQFTMEIDNVKVHIPVENNAKLLSMNLDDFLILNDVVDLSGEFINLGTNTISSIKVAWSSDGSTYNYSEITGLNVEPGATETFVHSVPFEVTVGGQGTILLQITEVNAQDDNSPTDNMLLDDYTVALATVDYMPLYEKFTSSTCGPCASFNDGFFNAHYTANEDNVNLINYQVNWPGAGDPYYTAEIGARVTYYGVNAAPTLLLDGKATPGTAGIPAMLTNESTLPSYFDLMATYTLTGDDLAIKVTTTPYLSGEFTVQAVVVEKVTTGNVATNGETSFKNVAMDIVPDASGTAIECVAGEEQSITLSANLGATNIEELSDIEIVVFIQSDDAKLVMQSTVADTALNTGLTESTSVKVYPNPSNGMVSVSTIDALDVIVFDTLGKQVFAQSAVQNGAQLNLSNLNSGVYFIQLQNQSTKKTEKLVIK